MDSLKKYNIQKFAAQYLQLARKAAESAGYNPALLDFSDRKEYKLMYDNSYYFGRNPYGDFLIYSILAAIGENPKYTRQYAKIKRSGYLARSAKIPGDWRTNKFSANNLARAILWSL